MPRTSAGLLMYRRLSGTLEVLLVHPGGPFWAKKDLGAWSIPKGEPEDGEDLLAAALREFEEETGFPHCAPYEPLGSVTQKGGKVVHAWAFEGDCDPAAVRSNTIKVRWPPGSGQWRTIPEVDRAEFFGLEEARRRINPAQAAFLDLLERHLAEGGNLRG
jgi:predicted NUDIX family NTP pyrophosphohydrolase